MVNIMVLRQNIYYKACACLKPPDQKVFAERLYLSYTAVCGEMGWRFKAHIFVALRQNIYYKACAYLKPPDQKVFAERLYLSYTAVCGEVAEWFKAHAWNACIG